jgi:hypothetical protein
LSVESIYGALLDLVAGGLIRSAEVERMVTPTYARTRAEFLAPFAGSGRFAGLAIEALEIFHEEDRIWAETGEGRDAHSFGARWAAFSRASVFPSLASALNGGPNDPPRATFFDQMELATTRRLASAPEKSPIPLAKLALVKLGPSEAANT